MLSPRIALFSPYYRRTNGASEIFDCALGSALKVEGVLVLSAAAGARRGAFGISVRMGLLAKVLKLTFVVSLRIATPSNPPS